MKSKIAVGVLALGALFLQASAQSVTPISVSSVQPYYANSYSYLDYRMGVVNLGNGSSVSNPINTPNIPTNSGTGMTNPTNNVCTPVLTTFNKFGDKNADVAALQNFLNQYNGANLNGLGYFGPATVQEIKNLQYAYGINPTGAQYEKTTALINALKCGSFAPHTRVIYYSRNVGGSVSTAYAPSAPVNVYPNAGQNAPTTMTNPVKTPTKIITGSPAMVGRPGMATNTAMGATTTTTNGFESDFQKIKDNYKAYILVFVLVLALFWFLRKAATE